MTVMAQFSVGNLVAAWPNRLKKLRSRDDDRLQSPDVGSNGLM